MHLQNGSLKTIALAATSIFAGCGAPASQSATNQSAVAACPPNVSGTPIAVPSGNALLFGLDATGVQIYTCAAGATGYAWTFTAPRANLFDSDGELVAKHFAGPTWQSVEDESSVVGSKIGALTKDPSSIPWLLLKAVSHTGDGDFSEVTYVQRVFTSGGLAPASGCGAQTAGSVADVPYMATYYFYRAGDGGGCR
jgi:hypothetical protein